MSTFILFLATLPELLKTKGKLIFLPTRVNAIYGAHGHIYMKQNRDQNAPRHWPFPLVRFGLSAWIFLCHPIFLRSRPTVQMISPSGLRKYPAIPISW